MSDTPVFAAAIAIEATASATHPDGAVLPAGDDQAAEPADHKEN